MSDTIPVSQQQIEEISNRIVHIEKMVGQIVEKLGDLTMSDEALAQRHKDTYVYEEGEPEYGTAAWWEWAEQQADAAIAQGEYVTLKTKEELQHYLDSLKQDDN